MDFVDTHVHSCYSHDSNQTVAEICQAALSRGLRGVTITDHANASHLNEENICEKIKKSAEEARFADIFMSGTLSVFSGIEISGCYHNTHSVNTLLNLTDYDLVLGSVHEIPYLDKMVSCSTMNFDQSVSRDLLYDLLHAYLTAVYVMVQNDNIDVVAHLTYPLRYINGKYHRDISMEKFAPMVDELLECMIQRNIALEINTSGICVNGGMLMPDENILKRYVALGGKLITFGSDAHTPDKIGNAFEKISVRLSHMGFSGWYHYRNRTPVFHPFVFGKERLL